MGELEDDAPKGGKKGGKKKKGGGKVAEPKPAEDEAVDETTPWKGKPSNFFVMQQSTQPPAEPFDQGNPMNMEMNDEQWNFIFKHYPEYGAAPHALMTWLYGQAQQNEQLVAQSNSAYANKPGLGGRKTGDDEEPQSIEDILSKGKKLNKPFDQNQVNK